MTFPDVDTLRLCSILSSSAFGFVFGVLWLRDRAASHFAYWGLSSFLYVGAIYAFTAVPRESLAAMSLIYGVLGLTNILPVVGALALERSRPWRRWMALPVVSAALGHALPGLLGALGLIPQSESWQRACDAAGLAISMGLPGLVLVGFGARPSVGRRLAGLAMLGYLPGYALAISGSFIDLPSKNLVALLALLSDQVLLSVLNLGLLAIPVEQVQRKLRHAALRDPLTACWNRAGLEQVSKRFLSPGTVAIAIDVDHFKTINDRYGHAAGDEVLKELGCAARTLSEEQGGHAARLGGDEFLVLLPVTCADPLRVMARLRDRIESSGNLARPWSVSMGLAQVETDDRLMDDVIVRADRSLYQAKTQRDLPLQTIA